MTSTITKRQQLWVCWQEPEVDRGKFSLIPSSWVAKSITGDGVSPGSLVLCRWPRSEELFTAKIMHDPSPHDLAQVEVMDVPGFMDDSSAAEATAKKTMIRKDRQLGGTNPPRGAGFNGGNGDDGNVMLGQLKRFFLVEMTKMSGEMQANFDILGHRIGALEVNMKCVRERVERIEKILNAAVNDLESQEQDQSSTFLNLQQRSAENESSERNSLTGNSRRVKREPQSKRQDMTVMSNESTDHAGVDGSGYDGSQGMPVMIPRIPDRSQRKDRNPRPNAIVVTCPKNRNIVLLGGDENYRMPLANYLDAIRHAKRPTATYMVTALLRRYLPYSTIAKLCVNERQLANTVGGQLLDDELLDILKKQGRMQFPNTAISDRDLMLRIEDVTRDVRRKIKLKRSMASANSRKSGGSSSTPISMVTQQRSMGSGISTLGTKSRPAPSYALEADDGDDNDVAMTAEGNEGLDENPEALPMFS